MTISIPNLIGDWLNGDANVLSAMVMIPLLLPSLPNSSKSIKVIVGLQGVSQKSTCRKKAMNLNITSSNKSVTRRGVQHSTLVTVFTRISAAALI